MTATINLQTPVSRTDLVNRGLIFIIEDEGGGLFEATVRDTASALQYISLNNDVMFTIDMLDGQQSSIIVDIPGINEDWRVVKVIERASMPDVVLFPETISNATDDGIIVFKDTIDGQAIVDGALELYSHNIDRYGDGYVYPDFVDGRTTGSKVLAIKSFGDDVIRFLSEQYVSVPSRLNWMSIYKETGWDENEVSFSQPQKMMWISGGNLTDEITPISNENENGIRVRLDADTDQYFWLSQNPHSKIKNCGNIPNRAMFVFNGPLSTNTVFDNIAENDENIMPCRLVSTERGVGLLPLYAMRMNDRAFDQVGPSLFWDTGEQLVQWGVQSPLFLLEV